MSHTRSVYISQHNHFDPLWRRCWDRAFDFKGKHYRSYADIEERVMNAWLDSAKRGAGFVEGQAVVFRKYLQRNPDRLEEIQDLVNKGLIELIACGETVSDTNMPSGETLLRNLVLGQRYFEDTFGIIPALGSLEDAFGQSAQLPQLFRGVECKIVHGLCYKPVQGPYWKGLDGSVVFIGAPPGRHTGHCDKTPPCPTCGGAGCKSCNDSGLADGPPVTDDSLRQALREDYSQYPFTIIAAGGEEATPNPNLPEIVAQARRDLGVDFQFGAVRPILERFADEIARVDDPTVEVADQVEGNPACAGCYVTRIKVKQRMRRVENLVNTAEKWAAVAYMLRADYPSDTLLHAWRSVVFVGFHDAITSTHLDQPYFELLDMLADAEGAANNVLDKAFAHIESHIPAEVKDRIVVYNSDSWERSDPVTFVFPNTQGAPTLKDHLGAELRVLDVSATGTEVSVTFMPPEAPPLGYAVIEVIPDSRPIHRGDTVNGPGSIENDFFTIGVSDKGIHSILDKRVGAEILDTAGYLANELILEEDVGHPWGATKPPAFQERLGEYTTGVKIRKAENTQEIIITGQYKGRDENVKILTWRQSVKLYAEVDRIDFHTEIDWDTAQRRIRVAFPTNIKTDDAVYAIPYGALKRSKYEPEFIDGPATNGDWPAVNWVDVYSAREDRGVALINTGAPSHTIVDGALFASLLRSPADHWCLNEPEYYDCPDFDGARDAGRHEFSYSLIPHGGDHGAANIEKRGREINNPLICRFFAGCGHGKLGLQHSFLRLDAADNVIVTAIKKADRDSSIIVRLAETAGRNGEASVSLQGAGAKASLVNFLERHPEPAPDKISLTPFKILTVRLSESG